MNTHSHTGTRGIPAAPKRRPFARQALLTLAGATLILGLAACAPGGDSASTSVSAPKSVAELPIAKGDVIGKPDLSNGKRFQVQVKAEGSEPLASAAAKLKGAEYTVREVAKDSIAATGKNYFVSVSVHDGVLRYSFAAR